MKKLTGLLAAVLVFAFSATSAFAATYTDAADQANVAVDAAAKLTALGITEGYEDGSFGFDKTITRAEFAKMAVIASGAESTATMLEGTKPSFTDVKAGAWYTGWINAAESLNLVQGDGNGNFRPNDTISNQEVVTVLMRMLGYNDNLPGAWPTNYVTEANKKDVLDDVSIVAAAAAKRGDVAVMVGNTLDTELVTYDKDTDEFVLKQTTKSDSDYITLLADAFKGAYEEVIAFDAVDQVRDVAKQQLNWNAGIVGYESVKDEDGKYATVAIGGDTYIIDAETRVSANGGDIFSLEGHQGKVYYVVENGKKYARFIDVESYVKLVGDKPEQDGNKVQVNNTKYNAVSGVNWAKFNEVDGKKNSKYLLYFNDDDQVYAVASDLNMDDKAYFVKSVSSSTIKLTGSAKANETIDNDDAEVLIWNGSEFVAPSTLQVGDAVIKIADDLYELTEAKTGVLKGETQSGKYNIDGVNYVVTGAVELDGEYETFDGDIDDAFGNTIAYLLNDDNSVSAIVVNETTVGSTLYGVVTGGETDSATSWGGSDLNSITVFTQEGTTVKYSLDDDEFETGDVTKEDYLGQMIEYKLNKDGEIKEMKVVATYNEDAKEEDKDFGTLDGKVEVKNNAYLTSGGKNLTLADSVVVFEIGEDDGDVDVALVTRAALLANDDFTPKSVAVDALAGGLDAYFAYVTNSNGAVKAIAYTEADMTNYYSGIIGSWSKVRDDVTMTFVGDETEYEFVKGDEKAADKDDLIVYTLKGGDVDVEKPYEDKADLKSVEVTGYVNGLITLGTKDYEPEVKDDAEEGKKVTDTIMTDANTVVYVQGNDGSYTEGTLDDISKGAWIVVPVADKDGYADIVIVDEYEKKDDNKIAADNGNTSTSGGAGENSGSEGQE